MIISTADISIPDVDTAIKRTYLYGLKYHSEFSYQEQLEEIYNHLTNKFGENGYVKIYLEDEEYNKFLEELRQSLANKTEFIERAKKVISKI